jgi:beta-glucanase (GH16 family)
LDRDPIWTWSDGGLIEGQIRFVKEAITFPDGKMRIETSNTLQVHTETCSHAEVDEIKPKDMTSGEIRTRHNMFRYGRYEASIRAPKVHPGSSLINGNYVATMFVFRDAKYKHWREIDVEVTGDSPDSITTNVLSADNTVKWSADIAESRSFKVGKNLRSDFHTFAFEWLPDRISWYLDGKLIREKKGGHVPIPDLSSKIMMNLWMFDHRALFGGRHIRNNRYPMHSEYDWFRFYKWDGDKKYPCPGFNTSCLTSDDLYLSGNNPCDGVPQVGDVHGKRPCKATCRSH